MGLGTKPRPMYVAFTTLEANYVRIYAANIKLSADVYPLILWARNK